MHWLLAIMIIGGLIFGYNILTEAPNSNPEKINLLRIHMVFGIVTLILMIIRIIIRFTTKKPQMLDTGNKILNKFAIIVHYLFYIIVVMIAISGIAIAISTDLIEIVFNNSGALLPESFADIKPKIAHELFANFLVILILIHIIGFIYHQFIKKDSIFSRMWFRKK